MPKILISYRQENAAHGQQVRALAERLRDRLDPLGIEVVLDQFLLAQKPGGPTEGWPKWCSKQVKEAARVVMIVSPGWADCFNDQEPADAGAGVACEAHVIWQELYDAHWKSDKHRVCLLDPSHASCIPTDLAGYHRFHSPSGDDGLCAWLREIVLPAPGTAATPPTLAWPAARTDFKHRLADRTEVFGFFQRMLAGQTGDQRILLIRADGNHGKTFLIEKFTEYAEGLMAWARVDLKGGLGTADVLSELNSELKRRLPGWSKAASLDAARERIEEIAQSRPLLLLFDTYEKGTEEFCKALEGLWVGAFRRSAGLCFVISGRKARDDGQTVLPEWTKPHWAKWVHAAEVTALPKAEDWELWARERHPALTRQHIEALAVGLNGVPGNVAAALDTIGAALGRTPAA
jgi:hypothetical protein